MTAPRELYWALFGAAGRHRGRRGPWRGAGKLGVSYGYTIVAARAKLPYGYSIDPRGRHAKKLHLVDGMWSAWHRGRLAGSIVRWRCGGMTRSAQLTGERCEPLCWLCLATVARQAEMAVAS